MLNRRYRFGEYQPIPDRDKGDFGLEGFTRDGTAFQFYAAEEPLSVDALTEKQKNKITRDIGKLCKNSAQIARVLDLVRLHMWVLLVPRIESKSLLTHAAKKAEEVRAKALPICTDRFSITVQTDSGFEVERQQILDAKLAKIPLQVAEADANEIQIWSQSNSDLVETLDQKLAKLHKPPATEKKLKAQMIRHFLEGQNAIDFLHANYPSVAEQVRNCKQNKAKFLATESLTTAALPMDFMRETLTSYQDRLAKEVNGIGEQTAEILAHEAVADWLFRCPLDFEG